MDLFLARHIPDGAASVRTINSKNNFLDTNVLLRHANGASGELGGDIQTILDEAVEGKRRLWVSSVIFAELRPSSFVPGTKSLSLLRLENYTFGLGSNPDVIAAANLSRVKPILPQITIPWPDDDSGRF